EAGLGRKEIGSWIVQADDGSLAVLQASASRWGCPAAQKRKIQTVQQRLFKYRLTRSVFFRSSDLTIRFFKHRVVVVQARSLPSPGRESAQWAGWPWRHSLPMSHHAVSPKSAQRRRNLFL